MLFCYRRTIILRAVVSLYPVASGLEKTLLAGYRTIRLKQENFSLEITRQITQEDINLLLTKTTAARSSQEAVMTSHCS